MVSRELKVSINRTQVLDQIDCYEENDLYEEVLGEYQEIEEKMYALCEPVFLLEPGVYEEKPVLMVIYSIGRGISDYATACFRTGDYLKGMLADAMADSALFSLEKEFLPYVKEICAELKMGISRRLEAPQDIPMEVQRLIFDTTKAQQKCGMKLSSGFMLDPVKSNALLYELTEDQDIFFHQHDCRNCTQVKCKMRQIKEVAVQVTVGEEKLSLMMREKESILEALMRMDASYSAVCGGRGTCGKCKIRVTEGSLEASEYDKRFFTKEEIADGMRLACKAYPEETLQVELFFQSEKQFVILSEHASGQSCDVLQQDTEFGLAVDIGTTTIAIQLISINTGKILETYTTLNHQRGYGADVIARIKASVDGKKELLRSLIQNDIKNGIHELIKKTHITADKVTKVAISGNTTMIHLLMAYNCESLGVYPFIPICTDRVNASYREIFGEDYLNASVTIMPGISAFVGGDIVSGLLMAEMDRRKEYSLLIDLGTNGEMALGNSEGIIVTSTAAGPAFEGGNIQWGIGSIAGAIAGVTISQEKCDVRVLGAEHPVGICGTGVIEAVAELVKNNLLDETGCLADAYFEKGYPLAVSADGKEIVLTQQDIREIQLAKAAVRAGIETMLLRSGVSRTEIAHVFLAGGFGFHLDVLKAIQIGMLPEDFADKVEIMGNSSLSGTVSCLLDSSLWARADVLAKEAKEINLSADKAFNQFYVDYMYFDTES